MKKISAILLLGLLLFNWCGYRWAIIFMQRTADIRLEATLDRNEYDQSQLIEIKVPVSIPYQTEQSDFERCDGEMEVNGIHYKFVGRKVQYGQLIFKCIPNQTRQRLESAKTDFFKAANDLQYNKDTKKSTDSHSTSKKNPVSDYIARQQLISYCQLSSFFKASFILYQHGLLIDLPGATPAQPPEHNVVC